MTIINFWLNYKLHPLILFKIQFSSLTFNFAKFGPPVSLCQNCAVNFQFCLKLDYVILGVYNCSNLTETIEMTELNKVKS